jgi:Glycosyl hydrolases family 43
MSISEMKTVRHRALRGLFGLVLLTTAIHLRGADTAFHPGEVWLDTAGNPINAHGGGMMFHSGTYFWYGENKEGRAWLPESTKAWDGYRVDVTGIRCYSSKDLRQWKDEGLVLKAVADDPSHDLHPSKVCERPKVLFNARTRKFVMWMHIDSEDYKAARAGVATADKPTGPFIYRQSVRPEGQDSRDQTVFQDDDGKAYRIYSSENNDTTYISLLTEDYLMHSGKFARAFEKRRMEAPVVFKHAGKYWFIGSDCTGWDPNPARSAVADSIWGPWTELGNPCRGEDSAGTFGGQSAFVFPVAGWDNAFIFMADRWNKTNLVDSRLLWLPLQFKENKPVVEWMPSWELSVFKPGRAAPRGGEAAKKKQGVDSGDRSRKTGHLSTRLMFTECLDRGALDETLFPSQPSSSGAALEHSLDCQPPLTLSGGGSGGACGEGFDDLDVLLEGS